MLVAESTGPEAIVLLDEKSARRVAIERGLRITGTVGLLSEAAERQLLDLASAIDRLTKTTFRYSPVLLKAMLDRRRNP
jgi:predicted nucleic acid-binding protein